MRSLQLPALVLPSVLLLWWRYNATPPLSGLHPPSDLINQYYPQAQYVAQRLAVGELPLWDPHACSGIPLLATLQVGVFYPGNWLALVLPADRALCWLMGIELGLAGLFAAAFFRALDTSVLPAAAGGVLFAFACVLGQTMWPPEVSTILWLPWLLLCVEKLVHRWRWRWWLGLAGGTALQLLAGFPQFVLYTFYLLVPFAALRFGQEIRRSGSPRPGMARVLGVGAGVLLGVGVAAVQLGPTLELVRHSARGGGLAAQEAQYTVLRIGLTDVLRNALDPAPKSPSFDFLDGTGYLGIATLIWIAVALLPPRRGGRAGLVVLAATLALGTLLLADGTLGWGRPLYELYAALPTGSLFRTPERLRLVSFFCLLILAVLGFDRITRERPRSGLVGVALVVAGVAVFGTWPALVRALAAGALVGAILVWGERVGPRRVAAVVLFALLVADLAWATGEYGSLRSFGKWARSFHALGHTVLDGHDFARLRDAAGLDRIAIVGLEPHHGAPPIDGGYRISCYGPLFPAQWPELHRRFGGDPARGATLGNLPREQASVLHDVASVRTIVVAHRGPLAPPLAREAAVARLHQIFRSQDGPLPKDPSWVTAEVRTNEDALPRAYLIQRYEVESPARALDRIARRELDPRRTVSLDRDPGLPTGAARPEDVRAATIVEYAPEFVAIEAESPSESLLVLTDTDYPGWRARVDGAETEILRANGLYRAVRLGPGRHQVEFEYAPASLRFGGWTSAASLLAVVLAPGLGLLVARRRSEEPAGQGRP